MMIRLNILEDCKISRRQQRFYLDSCCTLALFQFKLNDLINETKKTNYQLEKLRAQFVTMIKLQKDSKIQTKESKSED